MIVLRADVWLVKTSNEGRSMGRHNMGHNITLIFFFDVGRGTKPSYDVN